MQVIPFSIREKTYALPLDIIVAVDILPNVVFVDNSPAPLAGMILRRGELIPVWNSCLLMGLPSSLLKTLPRYLEISIQGKYIALPTEKIELAQDAIGFRSEKNFYGLPVLKKV